MTLTAAALNALTPPEEARPQVGRAWRSWGLRRHDALTWEL
jgi:hypothetical protein